METIDSVCKGNGRDSVISLALKQYPVLVNEYFFLTLCERNNKQNSKGRTQRKSSVFIEFLNYFHNYRLTT